MIDPQEDDAWSPLDSGAAPMPPVLGAGCASRFDPHSLNDESGANFPQGLPADIEASDASR